MEARGSSTQHHVLTTQFVKQRRAAGVEAALLPAEGAKVARFWCSETMIVALYCSKQRDPGSLAVLVVARIATPDVFFFSF